MIEKALKAYNDYEFHVIYHGLYNYCTLDLSAFYLDILKDRLYTQPPQSVERRSAQTVMYLILDAITRLMAPILAFTAEEIWNYLPDYPDKPESVHLVPLPEISQEWRDESLAKNWEQILAIRGEVTKALEQARAEKMVGHPLDAAVTISADSDIYDLLSPYSDKLREVFIVSRVDLVSDPAFEGTYASDDISGLKIGVASATGDKCERCWVHDPDVGTIADHPTICKRCKEALDRM